MESPQMSLVWLERKTAIENVLYANKEPETEKFADCGFNIQWIIYWKKKRHVYKFKTVMTWEAKEAVDGHMYGKK